MKKYFKLHPYVKIVDGVKCSAIYNLFKGKVFSITKKEFDFLKECEKGIPLEEIQNVDYEFVSDLKNNGLGLTYEGNVVINKEIYGVPKAVSKMFKQVSLDKLFIEITNKCNLNCKFCKEDNILFRKTGCKKWPSYSQSISLDEWEKIISEAKILGCKNFIIIGGEPFLEYENLKKIVTYIRKDNTENTKITVFTNGTLLDNNEIINYIKNNNLNLCIQILENNDTKYEKISEKKGVFSKIYNALNKIKENDILYSLVLLVSKFNEDNVNQIFEKFKGFNIRLEFIYPIKNDFYSKKYVNLMYDKSKDFVKPSLCSFEKFSKYNNCYKNVLAVSCDGLLYPCIMSRKLCLGSIKDFNLCEALINSENEGYPFLCRNKIEGCKTCHKRYGCLDCRALEMSATEDNVYGMNFCALLKGYRHE